MAASRHQMGLEPFSSLAWEIFPAIRTNVMSEHRRNEIYLKVSILH